MSDYKYKNKTYTRTELIDHLFDSGLIGDIEDLDHIMTCVDEITYEDAEDICAVLQTMTEKETD